MLILILVAFGTIFALSAISLLMIQKYKLDKGAIVVDELYNGPEQVSVTLHTIIRFVLRKSILIRKF